jgi:hypothetical protein
MERRKLAGILLGLLKRHRGKIIAIVKQDHRFTNKDAKNRILTASFPFAGINSDVSQLVVDIFIGYLEIQGVKVPKSVGDVKYIESFTEEDAIIEIARRLRETAPMFGCMNVGNVLGKSPVKKLINALVPPVVSRGYRHYDSSSDDGIGLRPAVV